jgi:transcriptional regulator with XRE-family HTH domain
MNSPDQARAMLQALKLHLRREGWTMKRLADRFAIGEATAKRWLAGKGLTLERLEQLAALCGLTLGELARETELPPAGLAQELTLAQEKALSGDAFLAFLFMTILGGDRPQDVATDFRVPDRDLDQALARLERLALIDRLPQGRIRPLVDRAIAWRKSPMRTLFETQMKPQFMAMDFAAEHSVYASEILRLSPVGAARLGELIERHRRDVQALAEEDRHASSLPRAWYGMLCAARQLDTSNLEKVI